MIIADAIKVNRGREGGGGGGGEREGRDSLNRLRGCSLRTFQACLNATNKVSPLLIALT